MAVPLRHRHDEGEPERRPDLRLLPPVESEPTRPAGTHETSDEHPARVARLYLFAYALGGALFLGLMAAVVAGANRWAWWPVLPAVAFGLFAVVCLRIACLARRS